MRCRADRELPRGGPLQSVRIKAYPRKPLAVVISSRKAKHAELGRINVNSWTPATIGGPITWLSPLAEPKEALALEALMDGWSPQEGIDPPPLQISPRGERSSRPQPTRCRTSSAEVIGTERSMEGPSGVQDICLLDIAFHWIGWNRWLLVILCWTGGSPG